MFSFFSPQQSTVLRQGVLREDGDRDRVFHIKQNMFYIVMLCPTELVHSVVIVC